MKRHRRLVKLLPPVVTVALLLATAACSGSSDDEVQSGIADCGGASEALVCLADVDSFGSETVSALDLADGGDPGEMSAGACTQSTSEGGPWSMCVVAIEDGQVIVGRDSGDGLSARTRLAGVDVEFPLDNVAGKATFLDGQATTFDVVDRAGATVGDLRGSGLTQSDS